MKRAANRKSASTSRARKKAFVDDMTAKNERMKQHALILSMLPDLVLAVCRSGEMTYVSPACQWLLLHSPEEITGANVFELVTHDCHALLRKMISDNLSRPVHAQSTAAAAVAQDLVETDGSDEDMSDDDECTRERPTKMAQHKERVQQQQHRQSSSTSSSNEGPHGKGVQVASPGSQGPKMLKLIRRDKTTVWCESRLSVRTAKRDGGAAPIPLEIILTLRTVSEGTKTPMPHEFVGSRVPVVESPPSERTVDADDYVEADDDGYQCEVDEEDSNNSGSGNDSGTTRNGHTISSGGTGGGGGGGGPNKKRTEAEVSTEPAVSDPMEGREERSLSKKRQRVRISNRMEDMLCAASGPGSDKSAGGESSFSRGTDTAGSTTQEGSGSGSNEVDSNGEGSNNGSSKWGDGCSVAARFNDRSRSPCGGSEDGGTSDGTSAEGTDFGDEVQSAVQSLILMGGDFSKGPQ